MLMHFSWILYFTNSFHVKSLCFNILSLPTTVPHTEMINAWQLFVSWCLQRIIQWINGSKYSNWEVAQTIRSSAKSSALQISLDSLGNERKVKLHLSPPHVMQEASSCAQLPTTCFLSASLKLHQPTRAIPVSKPYLRLQNDIKLESPQNWLLMVKLCKCFSLTKLQNSPKLTEVKCGLLAYQTCSHSRSKTKASLCFFWCRREKLKSA